MKGLLDFDKSMKNARAKYFLKSKPTLLPFTKALYIRN